MKTKKQIQQAVINVANQYGANVEWGTEDGITWLTLSGGNINPKVYNDVTMELSYATGVDCYFNKCWINSIEIAVDAQMDYYQDEAGEYHELKDNDIPPVYNKSRIEGYGTLFK